MSTVDSDATTVPEKKGCACSPRKPRQAPASAQGSRANEPALGLEASPDTLLLMPEAAYGAFGATGFLAARRAARHAGFPLLATFALLAVLAVHDLSQAVRSLGFMYSASASILPFFLTSIFVAAAAQASGADAVIGRAFVGRERRMIVMAAMLGALAPFCSCGVVPVVAGLLAAGVPIAPVMAFWIASPLMDPNMFVLTAGGLGLEFAVAKTAAAIGMGLLAGFATTAIARTGALEHGLKLKGGSGCAAACGSEPKRGTPVWRFWKDPARTQAFMVGSVRNAWFLGRWLLFAFALESLMLAYVPPSLISSWLGGDNAAAVLLAVAIGIPAYLNGYAAIPMVGGLIELGMSPAVGLGFMLAGGVTSVPAAIAVWALVKPRVFALYLLLAAVGALLSAYAYMAYIPA